MSNSTDLGSLPPVSGQRRNSPGDPFPKDYGGQGGGSGLESGEDGIDPDAGMTEEDKQCSVQPNRRIWEADARAAEGFADFKVYSSGQDIFAREHHAYLRYNGTTHELGNISVGPVPKPGETPYVFVNQAGIDGSNWMGDIHTHLSTDGRPSQSDINDFNRMYALAQAAGRTDLAQIAMHIAVRDTNSPNGYRIYSYTKTSDMNVLGKELDPNATRCP